MHPSLGVRTVWFLLGLVLLSACGNQQAWVERLQKMRDQQKSRVFLQTDVGKAMAGVNDLARITYVSTVDDRSQIFSIEPDGRRSLQLTFDPNYKAHPTWSLDHTRLAFYRYAEDKPITDQAAVWVMRADGSEAREVVPLKKIDTKRARITWRTDGAVLYIQEADFPNLLFGYDTASGKQVDTVRLPKQSFMTEAHSLSPDLSLIAGAGPVAGSPLLHLGTISRDGSKEQDFMKLFQAAPYRTGTVVWSYDSSLVAFELDTAIIVMSSTFSLGFRAYPLSGQDLEAELSGPAFSPSSKKLTCILSKAREGTVGSGDKEIVTNVWVMNINGTQQQQITTNGNCYDPHW